MLQNINHPALVTSMRDDQLPRVGVGVQKIRWAGTSKRDLNTALCGQTKAASPICSGGYRRMLTKGDTRVCKRLLGTIVKNASAKFGRALDCVRQDAARQCKGCTHGDQELCLSRLPAQIKSKCQGKSSSSRNVEHPLECDGSISLCVSIPARLICFRRRVHLVVTHARSQTKQNR